MNNDRRLDLIAVHATGELVQVFVSLGGLNLRNGESASIGGSRGLTLADVDDDGRVDILAAGTFRDRVAVILDACPNSNTRGDGGFRGIRR
jgi:hypothetical protein